MGNKPSSSLTSRFKKVQPSSLYHYNRLSPASNSQQPLLNDHNDYDQHEEKAEQLRLEIEASRKKHESMEKRNVALEKEIRELRAAALSKQETPPTSRVPLPPNIAALEKQFRELKPTVSKLHSSAASIQPVTPAISKGTSGIGLDVILKKKVDTLEHRLMQLEIDTLKSARKQKTSEGVQTSAESDSRLVMSIDKMKPIPSDHESDHLAINPVEQQLGNHGYVSTSDLAGCLMVLIFLVAVLIGLNL